MFEVEVIVTGSLRENCYVVGRAGEALVVDPGDDGEAIAARLEARGLSVLAILLTHAHHDHVGSAAEIVERTGAPLHMHSADASVLRWASISRVVARSEPPIVTPTVDVDLAGRSALRFGAIDVEVAHTPGHTPGSVCFAIGGELFTGDTVFADHVGRTDLREGDREALEASLGSLADRFPAQTTIRPGHGEPARLGDVIPRFAVLPELR